MRNNARLRPLTTCNPLFTTRIPFLSYGIEANYILPVTLLQIHRCVKSHCKMPYCPTVEHFSWQNKWASVGPLNERHSQSIDFAS